MTTPGRSDLKQGSRLVDLESAAGETLPKEGTRPGDRAARGIEQEIDRDFAETREMPGACEPVRYGDYFLLKINGLDPFLAFNLSGIVQLDGPVMYDQTALQPTIGRWCTRDENVWSAKFISPVFFPRQRGRRLFEWRGQRSDLPIQRLFLEWLQGLACTRFLPAPRNA